VSEHLPPVRDFGTGQRPRLGEERRERQRRRNRSKALGAPATHFGAMTLETEHGSLPMRVDLR
jgi:hypothetical protein